MFYSSTIAQGPGMKPLSCDFGTNKRNWLFAYGSLLQGDVDLKENIKKGQTHERKSLW